MNRQSGSVLVLGIGNTLLTDDGVGVHVINALRSTPEAGGLRLADGGTLGFRLAALMAEYPACIVVDAAELGVPPGELRVLNIDDLMLWLRGNAPMTVHEAGLASVLRFLYLEDRVPRHLAVVAVQPALIEVGETLTQPVAAAVPAVCAAVLDIVRVWKGAA